MAEALGKENVVPDAVLEIVGLEVTFEAEEGPVKAVDGVSLGLEPGRTLGLVGESGCGKTVTALAILGLVPPPGRITAGRVVLDGRDLLGLSEHQMDGVRGERIAMVFQEPMTALNPVFTIGEQIAEVLRLHHRTPRAEAAAHAVEMLAEVGIADAAVRAGAYPHQLSGGMRQRAMIAMALACRPQVLIADEPTTALDVTIQAQILDLILDAQRRLGMALLFISHNLAVISEVADTVAVMYAGRVVERGPADALFEAPFHPYTRGLIETLPDPANPHRRLPAIPGAVPALGALPSGCRFRDRCSLADERCAAAEPPLAFANGRWLACSKVTS